MRRRWLIAALGLLAAPAVRAQTVEIVEYGSYITSGDSPSPLNKPDNVVELRSVHDPHFVEQTTTIPGQLCQRFGIRFVLHDTPRPKRPFPYATLPLSIHVTHPRLANPDGRTSDSESWPQLVAPGEPSMAGFDFDQPWEIQPGTWTIAVEYNGQVLASKAFEVTDVPGGGAVGDGCQHLS